MTKFTTVLAWLGLQACQIHGLPHDAAAPGTNIEVRALPDSSSGNYSPSIVDCPSTRPSIRLANNLSDQETSWLRSRRNNTIDSLRTFLNLANIPNFDVDNFIDRNRRNASALPNVGIAVSGGGYRALLNGAGFLSAADSRNNKTGPISGLLQSATYLAGLSGGGWLVGSMFANNFSTIPDLQRGSDNSAIWKFDRSIFQGPEESGLSILNTADYWTEVHDQVDEKSKGWNTSITDYWGRALSYQLINAPEGGPAYTFSSIADTKDFEDADTPFPILVSDARNPGQRIVSLNATVFEFNPYEFGSWDPTTYGFAPTGYIASNFSDGSITRDGDCVRGFDQFGFVMGTSSSLFNQFLLQNITSAGDDAGIPSFLIDAVENLLKGLSKDEEDVARYAPNPFYNWDPTSDNVNAKDFQLSLVDGGEDLQNIPLNPLIQPFRAVDIIFAIDSSADTENSWPNGTALRATYDRSRSDIANGTLFPSIPSAETFINERLNLRPTLFGCDADNFTISDNGTVPPLIFYIPNAPYTYHSNVSTFDPSYPTEQRDEMILNGFNAATQGNGTVDEEWSVCVACAVLSRSWWNAGQSVPDACNRCFDRYCWNGTVDNSDVRNYDPAFIITAAAEDEDSDNAGHRIGGSIAWASLTLGMVCIAVLS